MKQDSFKYYNFHVFPKSLERIQLFKDNVDKLAFLVILANTCLDFDFSLFAFDVMNNHSHFMVGLKWFPLAKPKPDWLDHKIKQLIWNINRRYGQHYRRKYNYCGCIFAKNHDSYKPVHHKTDFVNKIKYIQNNMCSIGKYSVFEDNAFTSYNFYIAAFVQNPEFQNLPLIRQLTTSPTFLPLFQVLDLSYSIMQFDPDKSLYTGVLKFLEAHRNMLLDRDARSYNTNSTIRYNNLNIEPLLKNPALLQIINTKGHKVKTFIDSLYLAEINRKNSLEYFHTFSAFFPWHEKTHKNGLEESYSQIRKHYNVEFNSFIVAMGQNIGVNGIYTVTNVSRDYITNLLKEQ